MTAALEPAPRAPEIEDAEWHRLHPRMLLVHPVVEIGRAIPALLGLFFAGNAGGHGGYWSLIGAGVVAAWSLTRWFTTRLRITERDVQLRTGLLRRRTLTTHRDRIRTVDVTAHLLHRVLGLGRVVIGTGTNDRKGEGRIALDGLLLREAERLRDDLLHRRTSDDAVATDVGRTEIVRLDPRWIGYAPFTLSGVLTGLVLWGFYWRVQGESGIDLADAGPLHAVSDWFMSLATPVAVLVAVAAVVAFVALTSTAGYVLAFWRFRLVRDDGGTLQVTRGLITSRATSIDRRRLVGVQVSEPLPLRMVGASRLLAVATGLRAGRGAERGGEILLPPAPDQVARDTATAVLDGTPAVTAALSPHPPAALRRRVGRAVGAAAIAFVAAVVLAVLIGTDLPPAWTLAPAAAVVLVVAVALGRDRYASLGHTRSDGYLVAGLGSVVRRRSLLREDAIIGWTIRATVFQRRLGLVSAVATTAAGRQGYDVDDVDPGTALDLAEAISGDLVTQFRALPAGRPATAR